MSNFLEKPKDRVVTIVAVNNHYKELPLYLVPRQGERGELLTGYHTFGADAINKYKEIFPLEKNQQVPVVNMERLDLSNDKDRCKYNFLLTHGEIIALDKDKAIQNKHLFYIHDVEKESEDALWKDDLMIEAMNAVKDKVSDANILDLAIFVLDGEDPRGYSSNVLRKRIYDVCKKDPDRVMKYFKSGQDTLLFVRKAHVYEVISERPDGFFFGDIYLGHSYEEIVSYITQTGNQSIYSTMLKKLTDLSKPKTSSAGHKKTTAKK